MKKWKIPLAMTALGVLAARCSFLPDLYPFGVAVLSVFIKENTFFYLFVGTLAGAVTQAGTPEEALLAVLPYALLLPMLQLLKRFRKDSLPFLMLASFSAFLIPALVLPGELLTRMIGVFNGLSSAVLVPIIMRLYSSAEQIEHRLSLEKADVLALCCVGTLAISSLPRTDWWGFDLSVTALLTTSAFAAVSFQTRGSIWAAVCGILWVVKGGDTAVALCLIAGGLLAGLLSDKRGGVLLGFVAGDLLLSLFLFQKPVLSCGIFNLIAGCAYTAFLPAKAVARLRRFAGIYSGVNDLEMRYIDSLRRRQKSKLLSAARMYRELARAFTQARCDDVFKEELLTRTLSVCSRCKKRAYCLESRRSDTRLELAQAAEALADRGGAPVLPLTLTARCIQPVVLQETMAREFQTLARGARENPDRESELAEQLGGLAELLFSLADELNELPEFDKEKERDVRDVLTARVDEPEEVSCRREGDGVVIQIEMKKNRKNLAKDICRALEAGGVGRYRCLTGGTGRTGGFSGLFAQTPRYEIEAYACRVSKQGERICGDSFTFCPVEYDGFLAAISDGAGSGERAARESESALDLLEAFAAARVKRTDMFRTMNRLLLLKGDRESFSTMDVAEFDLDAGVLYWTKIGAVPGYILRGGKVEKIETGTLPMGIVTKINPSTTKKLVQNGDVIVLVSDGVYDGLCRGQEDSISAFLTEEDKPSAREWAESLLARAGKTKHDDDMTVLVLKVKAA
ncbi:MAG: SpoIIE family protein phosphatase [Clostridia bacterium]|nr:SpoIIE family protein phosphatase [Clostridia bacterium]